MKKAIPWISLAWSLILAIIAVRGIETIGHWMPPSFYAYSELSDKAALAGENDTAETYKEAAWVEARHTGRILDRAVIASLACGACSVIFFVIGMKKFKQK